MSETDAIEGLVQDPWRKSVASNEPTLEELQDWVERPSYHQVASALVGVSFLAVCVSLWFPLVIESRVLSELSSFAARMCVIHTMVFPSLAIASFAVVVPMFWYGSLHLRLATSLITFLPGASCATFVFWLTNSNGSELIFPTALVLFAFFLGAATVSVMTQMATPWTLAHAGSDRVSVAPFGLRMMIEFTALIAVGCSVSLLPTAEEYYVGIITMVGFGVVSGFTAVRFMIAFLNESREIRWIEATLVFPLTFLGALALTCLGAVEGEGWTLGMAEVPLILTLSLFGTFTAFVSAAICLAWLRGCGWCCIDRRRTNQSSTRAN